MGEVSLLTCSFFPRDNIPHAKTEDESWEEFLNRLSKPQPKDVPKKSLPLWAPATFREQYRNKRNVERVYLLTFDVDESPVPDAGRLLEVLEGVQCAVHSSSSATANAPRWRLAVRLSRPASPEEYPRIWSAFTSSLPFKVGQQSKDASRGWYAPREGPDGFYKAFEIPGEPIDVEMLLAAAPAQPSPKVEQPSISTPSKTRAAKMAAAATMLGKAWPEKGRHEAQLALAGALYHANWAQDAATDFLCDVCREAGDEDRQKREASIRGTWARGAAGEEIVGWTRLSQHVDAHVVDAARGLLKRDDFAEIRESLRPKGESQEEASRLSPADRALKIGGAATRLKTGFPSVDKATREGLLLGKVVAVGGAPGAGKTALMVKLAFRWLNAGTPVAFLASDEDADAILIRFGQLAGISRDELEYGKPEAREALANWCRTVPLILADGDEENETIEALGVELRPGGVLFVDSMQTARSAEELPKGSDLRARVNQTVRALKRAAKVRGHLVIASSELSKAAYRNKAQAENVNALSAFKESGDIEYGVGLAIVLVSHQGTTDLVDAAIVKNRLGPGKPEFLLRLDHVRADVSETTPDAVTSLDPLYFKKEEILTYVDEAHGAESTKKFLCDRVGGRREVTLKAINALVEEKILFQSKNGVRRPLPGDPGFKQPDE